MTRRLSEPAAAPLYPAVPGSYVRPRSAAVLSKKRASLMLGLVLLVACSGSTGLIQSPMPDASAPPVAQLAAPLVESAPEPPESKALPVKVVKLTKAVRRGAKASITIKTAAAARCSIRVLYKSGPSTAKGLGRKKAKANGRITWTWIVGTRTTKGRWPIEIECSKGSREGDLSAAFRVK